MTRVLIERLRSGLMSRNRHHGLFRRGDAREALRVHRFLRSVEHDLLAHDGRDLEVEVHRGENGVRLDIQIPRLGARRSCSLSDAEYSLLLSNPRVRELLGAPLR